jgi:hypothetical protein
MTEANTTAHTVTARKAVRCDDYPCKNIIQPGEDYVRHVAFPGCEFHGGDQPLVMRSCMDCTTRYGRRVPPRRNARAVSHRG